MTIEQSVKNIIAGLYDSDFAAENVDLTIEDIGKLNYSLGRKLRLKFVDNFENDDIEEWRLIASENGAQLSFSMKPGDSYPTLAPTGTTTRTEHYPDSNSSAKKLSGITFGKTTKQKKTV